LIRVETGDSAFAETPDPGSGIANPQIAVLRGEQTADGQRSGIGRLIRQNISHHTHQHSVRSPSPESPGRILRHGPDEPVTGRQAEGLKLVPVQAVERIGCVSSDPHIVVARDQQGAH
jgi:hypothetical protein